VKFIISFEKTIQVAEDSFRVSLRTMIANDNTTIGQIKEWYSRDMNKYNSLQACKMDDIKISEPEGD